MDEIEEMRYEISMEGVGGQGQRGRQNQYEQVRNAYGGLWYGDADHDDNSI